MGNKKTRKRSVKLQRKRRSQHAYTIRLQKLSAQSVTNKECEGSNLLLDPENVCNAPEQSISNKDNPDSVSNLTPETVCDAHEQSISNKDNPDSVSILTPETVCDAQKHENKNNDNGRNINVDPFFSQLQDVSHDPLLCGLKSVEMTQQTPRAEPAASVCIESGNDLSDSDDFGLNSTESETPHTEALEQCCFCADLSKDCVLLTEDKPYITRNRTALIINDLSVELDFNSASPKTVCGNCDEKLQAMHDFIKQVKHTQTIINVRHEFDVRVKTEDYTSDESESKDGIIDSITVTETEIINTSKRKIDFEDTPTTTKIPRVTSDNHSSELATVIENVDTTIKCKRGVEDTHETDNIANTKDTEEESDMRIDIKTEPDTLNAENFELDKETVTLPYEFNYVND